MSLGCWGESLKTPEDPEWAYNHLPGISRPSTCEQLLEAGSKAPPGSHGIVLGVCSWRLDAGHLDVRLNPGGHGITWAGAHRAAYVTLSLPPGHRSSRRDGSETLRPLCGQLARPSPTPPWARHLGLAVAGHCLIRTEPPHLRFPPAIVTNRCDPVLPAAARVCRKQALRLPWNSEPSPALT